MEDGADDASLASSVETVPYSTSSDFVKVRVKNKKTGAQEVLRVKKGTTISSLVNSSKKPKEKSRWPLIFLLLLGLVCVAVLIPRHSVDMEEEIRVRTDELRDEFLFRTELFKQELRQEFKQEILDKTSPKKPASKIGMVVGSAAVAATAAFRSSLARAAPVAAAAASAPVVGTTTASTAAAAASVPAASSSGIVWVGSATIRLVSRVIRCAVTHFVAPLFRVVAPALLMPFQLIF